MGNFTGLTEFYIRLISSRCLPAEPAAPDEDRPGVKDAITDRQGEQT